MNCAQFQRVLPYIIESGGSAEEEAHLKSCPICSDLVADLKYIAEQAKLLVPMMDPSPRVWQGIARALEQEGLVRCDRPRGRLLAFQSGSRWGPASWLVPVAAAVLLVAGLWLYRNAGPGSTAQTAAVAVSPDSAPAGIISYASTAAGGMDDAQDRQLLEQVGARVPSLRAVYEANLKHVNAFISDARRTLVQNPGDEEAQQYLMSAYQQKAMLYEMATAQALP